MIASNVPPVLSAVLASTAHETSRASGCFHNDKLNSQGCQVPIVCGRDRNKGVIIWSSGQGISGDC
jgi:hypothetical protein